MSDKNTKSPDIFTINVGSNIPLDALKKDASYGIGGHVGNAGITWQHDHFITQLDANAIIPHKVNDPSSNNGIEYALESIPQASGRGMIGRYAKVDHGKLGALGLIGIGAREIKNIAPGQTQKAEQQALDTLQSALEAKQAKLDDLANAEANLANLASQSRSAKTTALVSSQMAQIEQARSTLNSINLPDYDLTKQRLDAALHNPTGPQVFANAFVQAHRSLPLGGVELRPFVEAGGEIGTASKSALVGAGLTVGRHPDSVPNQLPGMLPQEQGYTLTPSPDQTKGGDWQMTARVTRYMIGQNPYYSGELPRSTVTEKSVQAAVALSHHVAIFAYAKETENPSQGIDLPAPLAKGLTGPGKERSAGAGISVKF